MLMLEACYITSQYSILFTDNNLRHPGLIYSSIKLVKDKIADHLYQVTGALKFIRCF